MIFLTMLCIAAVSFDVHARHYSGQTIVSCNITIQTTILPVYYSDQSLPRNNPDGSYYPGDAFHFVIRYDGSDTCMNFTVHPLQSSGGLIVTYHKGSDYQHGSPIRGYSDYDADKREHPLESNKSIASFEKTIQKCKDETEANSGCVSGHAEIAVNQDELNQVHCTTNDKTKRKVCAEIDNKISLKVSGQKKVCRIINGKATCSWVTVSRTASFAPSMLNPDISMNVTKENLADSDGFTIRNLDGTYYLWDAINVIHWPVYKWQNERAGTIESVTTKSYDITNEKEFECKKTGSCNYTLKHRNIAHWSNVFDHGAGLTIYNGTSQKDLGYHSFRYKVDLFNIGRHLNTTSGSTGALIVRYDPVYGSYPYNMLEDNHWWAYGNRPAVALHYFGSLGGGPNDSAGIHELRRSKINSFEYTGYAFDPINKVFLNETMTWNDAEPIILSLQKKCNKTVFDPTSFETENNTGVKDSAMFVKSGYGKIIFNYPILRTLLKERFHEVTIENTLQSVNFGGSKITNTTDYEYIYPRVKFHTSVKVLAVDSQGELINIPLSIVMTPQFGKGAVYTQDYLCKKIFYDTQDKGFSDIVIDDMYVKDANKKNGTGYVNLKASLTSTWFPNYTGAFFASSNYTFNDTRQNPYKTVLDIPINFGFGALSPYNITITADSKSHTFDVETFQFYSNHLFVVNFDQNNILNVTRDKQNKNLVYIHYDKNFGPIQEVFINGTKYDQRCRTGCSVIVPSNESLQLEAYNVWGGMTSASLEPVESKKKNISPSESNVFWYAMLGLIVGAILLVESKRVLRWLGFSSMD